MREMKDSGIEWIGEIPADWKVSKVKYFTKCLDGKRKPIDASSRKSGIYPYWGAGSIVDYIDEYLFDEEVILLGEDGAPFFDYTRPVSFLVNEKVWVNNHIHVLKPDSKNVDSAFLVYWLNNVDYKTYINGSILCKLTQSNMNNIAVAIPSLAEQQKISTYLDTKCTKIDSIIEKQEKVIEKLKEYKLSVITEAVTKGLNPDVKMKDSGVEWIGEIPEEWKVIKAKYCVLITNGSDPKTEGNIPVYGSGSSSFKTCGEFKEGPCVLIGRKGATLHIPHYILGKYWNVDTAFDVKSLDRILLKFYYFLAICFDYKIFMSQTTLPSMTQTAYENMILPIPSIEEQTDICNYLDKKCSAIDKSIEQKQAIIEKLKEYKKSLIYEVVTGKREV